MSAFFSPGEQLIGRSLSVEHVGPLVRYVCGQMMISPDVPASELTFVDDAHRAVYVLLEVVGEAWKPHSHILVIPQVRVLPARPNSQLASIESVNANIEIVDQVAVTSLEIILRNPSSSPMERMPTRGFFMPQTASP